MTKSLNIRTMGFEDTRRILNDVTHTLSKQQLMVMTCGSAWHSKYIKSFLIFVSGQVSEYSNWSSLGKLYTLNGYLDWHLSLSVSH